MARKSRKNLETDAMSAAAASVVSTVGYKTAVYARLSNENNGKGDAGDSIANQISICMEYLQGQADLELYGVYEDNGRTGTNFDRPEFGRLMDDVRAGKVNCILVKDLSRFGRDYIEAGEYLEKIFPFMGVRFISVTDRYDSMTAADSEGSLMIPLKNMINDAYAKDISRKIITSFRARQEKGEFLPAMAPYGYLRSETEKYRYVIDPVTAPYVRMMFEWKAAGVGRGEMAKRLTELGAPTPSQRKVELGIWDPDKHKSSTWYRCSFSGILTNPTYTGCIVYGRVPKSLYQGIKSHRAKADELRILPDMHEPIVSQELFERVQEVFKENKQKLEEKMAASEKDRAESVDVFRNKLYCGDCGKKMDVHKFKNTYSGTPPYYITYLCMEFRTTGGTRCSRHSIGSVWLKKAVLAVILEQVRYALDAEELMRRMSESGQSRNLRDLYDGKRRQYAEELDRINEKRGRLFEGYADGILDEAEYSSAKQKYDADAAAIGKLMEETAVKQTQIEAVLSGDNAWLQALHRADGAAELTAEMVEDLVKRVRIFEGKRIEVELNYTEQKRVYEGILAELTKEVDPDA